MYEHGSASTPQETIKAQARGIGSIGSWAGWGCKRNVQRTDHASVLLVLPTASTAYHHHKHHHRHHHYCCY